MRILTEVAKSYQNANVTIGLHKSKFRFRFLKYLGFVIGEGSLSTDPGKIQAIDEIPVPKNVGQLRSFLGIAGWYRRFIRGFSDVSVPLTYCLKLKTTFKWTPAAEEAFSKL